MRSSCPSFAFLLFILREDLSFNSLRHVVVVVDDDVESLPREHFTHHAVEEEGVTPFNEFPNH